RGGNGTAVQSRWRTSEGATSQDESAEEPRYVKGCASWQFIRRPPGNKGRAAQQRTERGAAAAECDRRRPQHHQPLDVRSAEGAQHTSRLGGTFVRGR